MQKDDILRFVKERFRHKRKNLVSCDEEGFINAQAKRELEQPIPEYN